MNWQSTIEKLNNIVFSDGAEVDPFMRLVTAKFEGESARVSMTVGRNLQYGELKCSATVTIDCPQKEEYINLAGEIAFTKALELVNDAMTQFDVERIGEGNG